MLLLEWYAWWNAMPHLQAEESLLQFSINQVSDAGWQMDREPLLSSWRELAAGAVAMVSNMLSGYDPSLDANGEDRYKPGMLRQTTWRIWSWLRSGYGGGVN